mmetsp:Transcript_33172/g.65106  ORF Transcript_33172/g.65106 Transcript_33172/m.65106 type:complete len:1415 (+) Transcript_33172:43-4287(+)|eukprot:CAMPEP_0175140744 /NCGR_PEP_ID=MMETSP0087-20121206/11695_1 /TAXON_ID=136419 /ORGANISM="Unknown Unknown, Strain D1" /LENGTH=1414 /DNA_ID=CAMNT_0016424033 /DNA_START=39 /DNA_END=4283 /DNA_ORIENTATION=-
MSDNKAAGSGPVFPVEGIMPKREIGAAQFIEKHPNYDGRGVVVAIFDTGCDQNTEGLQVTTEGKPKFLDFVDCSGSGDTDTSTVVTAKEGKIVGLSGRTLKIPLTWKNPSGKFNIGVKHGYDLFPGALQRRIKQERKELFDARQKDLINNCHRAIDDFKRNGKFPEGQTKTSWEKELNARLTQAQELSKYFEDPGPIYDVVVWNDGANWRAAVDKSEKGDLASSKAMTNYRIEREFDTFSGQDLCNYSVNVYDEGKVCTIVVAAGAHGTHVAGIVGGNYPNQPELNGIAPGCQLISVKIGDSRLGSMETGTGLIRGLKACLRMKCDMINLSYGEATTVANSGYFTQLANELVETHGVIFVSSAGNSGPALSTVGAPGGTSEGLIGVGAYVSPAMMEAEYQMRRPVQENMFSWSSRGPTYDGDQGVCISACGGAIAPVPTYSLQRNMLMNGTSMSSPAACGAIALLVSGAKQEGLPYTPMSVRRAVENTAREMNHLERLSQGCGLLQVPPSFLHLKAFAASSPDQNRTFKVNIASRGNARGVYLREYHESTKKHEISVSVRPYFRKPCLSEGDEDQAADNVAKVQFNFKCSLVATARWVSVCKHMLIYNGGRGFDVEVDPTALPPGAHFAEVLGFDSTNVARGPVFRLPITVIRCEEPQPLDPAGPSLCEGGRYDFSGIVFKAGTIHRKFLRVPAGATWADITLRAEQADTPKTFKFHSCFLRKGQSFSNNEVKKAFVLGKGEQVQFSMAVTEGAVVEATLAQYWNSVGDSTASMTVTFQGLVPSKTDVVITNCDTAARVEVVSPLCRSGVEPKASLTHLNQVCLPQPGSAELRPLCPERDGFPGNRQAYELVQTYKWSCKEKSKLTVKIPALNDVLYEACFGAQLALLFDCNKKLVGTFDAFDETVTVAKGTYTLRLQVRHDDPKLLDKVKGTPATFKTALAKPVNLDVFASAAAAIQGSPKFGTIALSKGAHSPVYFVPPSAKSLPSSANPGDVLSGKIFYGKLSSRSPFFSDGKRPSGFHLRVVVPEKVAAGKSSSSSSASNDKGAEDKSKEQQLSAKLARDVHKANMEHLKRLGAAGGSSSGDGEGGESTRHAFEDIFGKLVAADTGDNPLSLLSARLNYLDCTVKKECASSLWEVVDAANAVVASVDQQALAAHFGKRQPKEDACSDLLLLSQDCPSSSSSAEANADANSISSEVAKQKKLQEEAKQALVSALETKLRALTSLVGIADKAKAEAVQREESSELKTGIQDPSWNQVQAGDFADEESLLSAAVGDFFCPLPAPAPAPAAPAPPAEQEESKHNGGNQCADRPSSPEQLLQMFTEAFKNLEEWSDTAKDAKRFLPLRLFKYRRANCHGHALAAITAALKAHEGASDKKLLQEALQTLKDLNYSQWAALAEATLISDFPKQFSLF